jgi:hypothetical protein
VGTAEQIILIVAYIIKGITLSKIGALIMNHSAVLKRAS